MLVCSFTVLGASRAVAQSNTIWVDSSISTPGNGTQTNPYKSLSYALTNHPGIGVNSFTVMVAGNGFSFPYRTTNGAPADSTEEFPIKVPAQAQLVYWDVLGLLPNSRPASVVFHPGDSTAQTCLVLPQHSANSGQKGISGYLQTTVIPYPDRNQGFEIHEFELAIDVYDTTLGFSGPKLDALLDGVSTFECQKSVRVSNLAATDFECLIKRSVFRGPSGTVFAPNSPVVEVVFGALGPGSGQNTPWIEFRKCDLRPTGADLQNSLVTILKQGDADDYLQVLIKNCHLSGQPLVLPVPPNPAQRILGACIEAAWEADSRGRVTIEDSLLWDAVGDGILGSVQGGGEAQGEITIRGCDVAYHGDSNLSPVQPSIAAASFSGSGIHLAAREKGDWLNVDLHSTESLDNHRHGAFLELGSFPDEDDAFRNVDVNYCNFSRNGHELGPVTEGHGMYVDLKEASIHLEVHRSLFADNHTTGIKAFLRDCDTPRGDVFEVTNSVISANDGIADSDPGQYPWYLPRHTAPFTVMSEDGDHVATINLSHVTFTDNEAPYAVSLYEMNDPTYGIAYQVLWSDASTVDNAILKKNHFLLGGQTVDQAYYPEPPDPNNPPPAGHLWLRMFESTSHSNLGNQTPQFFMAYTTARSNFYADPLLEALTLLDTQLGLVMPGVSTGIISPLVDTGGPPVHASETTDVRGPGFPRVVDYGNNGSPIRDVGAFELQN